MSLARIGEMDFDRSLGSHREFGLHFDYGSRWANVFNFLSTRTRLLGFHTSFDSQIVIGFHP